MMTIVEQLEAYRKFHCIVNTVKNISPHNKTKPGGKEREQRRTTIYTKMQDGKVYTVSELQKSFEHMTTREISSAVKVLVMNGFVEIVGRTKVNNCKICLYKVKK